MALLPGLAAAQEQADKVQKSLPHTSADQMIKLVLGLLFVLFLIFLLAWLFKKYLGGSVIYNASLRSVAGVSVGQKERVVLMQVGERQILVGVAPGQVNMLYALEKGDEIKPPTPAEKGAFAEKLKQSLTRLDKQ
ncbi:hypothetical protein Tel_05725 [Candidatus Tenderia electrophaga]|jgi:flagellar protein FliO/FliZ|uniref:Flagellar protein n=1 Tax=Candidatus Tenderia electrophaga TaxID=1748243 RepID=A0A0S2TC03_9GAMM|nr:hypothetical protein Tel_05725 [Candidatus Tenderia electrophaga]